MKQIKDFNTSSLSYVNADYFIFQRDIDGVTYKITHSNIIKDCIKYTDTDFVHSLDWSKLINRPSIPCVLSGMATGSGSINLNATNPALTISVSTLDLSSVTLGFIPVTQLGSNRISLEWDAGINAMQLTIGTTFKGEIAMVGDLLWGSIQEKPVMSISVTGMATGVGMMDLMATSAMTLNITDLTMKALPWTMVQTKPALTIEIKDSTQAGTFNLNALIDNEEQVLTFDVHHSQLNVLKFGDRTQMCALYMNVAPDIDIYHPSTYDLAIMRFEGNDAKAAILNTIGGSLARSSDSSEWATWSPTDPLNTTNWSYRNRIEMFPLLQTPYLIVSRQAVTEMVANEINITGQLKYNGIYIDLASLIDMIAERSAAN